MKKIIGYAVLAFVGLSLAFAFFQERGTAPQSVPEPLAAGPAQPEPPKADAPAKPRRQGPVTVRPTAPLETVVARYCHGHARCSNCMKIEEYSREAIETGLRKELDSGRLKFETLNIEEPANRHFVKDYGLYTKSLVLVARSDGKEGRYKVLNDVWEHLDDKEAFVAYVTKETKAFLK